MIWSDKLSEWSNSVVQTYPLSIEDNFFWETSPFLDNASNYIEHFVINKSLNKLKQNYTPFIEYINKSNDKNVISFYNKSKDAILVIPIPRKNKNFTTLKDFIDNASKTQQILFWKEVAKQTLKFFKKNKIVYVSTHGLGVHYLHVRIESTPKYYSTTFLL